jgi:hypothetical protein
MYITSFFLENTNDRGTGTYINTYIQTCMCLYKHEESLLAMYKGCEIRGVSIQDSQGGNQNGQGEVTIKMVGGDG